MEVLPSRIASAEGCAVEEKKDVALGATQIEVYFEKSLRVLEHLLRFYTPVMRDSCMRRTLSESSGMPMGGSSPSRKVRRKRVMLAGQGKMKKKGGGTSSEDELLTSELEEVLVNMDESNRRILSKPKRRLVVSSATISEDPFDGPPLFETPLTFLATLHNVHVKSGGLSVFFELVLGVYKSLNLFSNHRCWTWSLDIADMLLKLLTETCRRIEERTSANSIRGHSVHNVLIHLAVRLACRCAVICEAPKNTQSYLRHLLLKVSQM